MAKAGRVQSREILLDRVWGDHSEADVRTVDVHIRCLRKQLTKKGKADPIRTVQEGYIIDPSLDPQALLCLWQISNVLNM